MKKKLKFFGNTGKFDSVIFIASVNEPLIIELLVDTGRTVDYYATIQNEKGCKTVVKIKDKMFEVPKDVIVYGSLDLTITAKVGAETVNTFFCEKLIVKDVGGQKQVIPEIEALHLELDKIKNDFKALAKEVNEKVEKQNKCIKALMEE